MIDRMKRVSEMLKREVAAILAEKINDPRIRKVTVTRVEVSRDLRTCKVFCILNAEEIEIKSIMTGLKASSKFIQLELSRTVKIKFIPKLTFINDQSFEKEEAIESLFEKIASEREERLKMRIEGGIRDTANMEHVIEMLKNRDNFLISAHVNPEGDSIGSQIAMYELLKSLGKEAIIVNHDSVPEGLMFLEGADQISTEIPEDIDAYTIIMLDCPVKERTGRVGENLNPRQFVINIDHHISNENFGDINWVEADSSSVGEMIFAMAKHAGFEINISMAQAIYTAIVTDTGMFNYSNTSSYTHEVVASLFGLGVDPKYMHSQIFEKKDLNEIKLLGKVVSGVQLYDEGKIACITLTKKMYEDVGASNISTDEFINFPRSIAGVIVTIFFKESPTEKNVINISFRSSGNINVNEIASIFGGGGHPKASGCVINASLGEAEKLVLKEVRKVLDEKS